MTNEEAIKVLQEHKIVTQHDFGWNVKVFNAIDIAIDAITKQISLKPGIKELSISGYPFYPCGNCGEELRRQYDWCLCCGQRIDWSEIE